MMALSPGALCKLAGEIKTTKMTMLVIFLVALRPIPTYRLLCSVSLRADPCKLPSQALLLTGLHLVWLMGFKLLIQEQTQSRLGNFSPSLCFQSVFGSSYVASVVLAPTGLQQC